MSRDRLTLWVCYALLVGVTAWTAYDTRRALDRIEDDVCATAEIVIANELATLFVFGEQEGVDSANVEFIISEYIEAAENIEDRCGAVLLDDIIDR